ncbi:hypothetical protein ACWGR3_30650 [Streptomyces albidoflavus]
MRGKVSRAERELRTMCRRIPPLGQGPSRVSCNDSVWLNVLDDNRSSAYDGAGSDQDRLTSAGEDHRAGSNAHSISDNHRTRYGALYGNPVPDPNIIADDHIGMNDDGKATVPEAHISPEPDLIGQHRLEQ